MTTKESRDDSLYGKLPLLTRAIIRTIVVLLHWLNIVLEKERMTASFDVSVIIPELPEKEEREYMQ